MPSSIFVEGMEDVLAQLATGRYTLLRGAAPVSDGHGRFTPGATTTVPDVLCSVQPVDGDEVERVPEGDRLDAWRQVYAEHQLRAASQVEGVAGDVILLDPFTNGPGTVPFEVQRVYSWHPSTNVTYADVRLKET